jgi:hypothetical protein
MRGRVLPNTILFVGTGDAERHSSAHGDGLEDADTDPDSHSPALGNPVA